MGVFCGRCGQAAAQSAYPCPTCGITAWRQDTGDVAAVLHPLDGLQLSLAQLRGEVHAPDVVHEVVNDPFAPEGSPAALARTVLYSWPQDDPPRHVSGANLLAKTTVTSPLTGLLGAITVPVGPVGLTLGGGQLGGKQSTTQLSPVDAGALIVSRERFAYVGRLQHLSGEFRSVLGFQSNTLAQAVVRIAMHLTDRTEPLGFDVLHDGRSPSSAFYLEWGVAQAYGRVADLEDRLQRQLHALQQTNHDVLSRYCATSPVYAHAYALQQARPTSQA